VIADPVQHSLSPAIHNRSFVEMGLNCAYVPFRVAPEDLNEFIDRAPELGVCGLSVTIPHKVEIIKKLNGFVDPAVRATGACNTVVWGADGRLNGYNTDYLAALLSIETAMGRKVGAPSPLQGASAMVLGAGGAAQAVKAALDRLGFRFEVFRRRTPAAGFELFVNATPVDPIPDYAFTGREAVYDLRYAPAETELMHRARAAGCRVENGLSMLVAQARGQRRIWGMA
jgi:3-dehydroquinate dehydratase/shikimate dehydrogenase